MGIINERGRNEFEICSIICGYIAQRQRCSLWRDSQVRNLTCLGLIAESWIRENILRIQRNIFLNLYNSKFATANFLPV